MKVFLTSAYPYHPTDNFTPEYLKESAAVDSFKVHEVVEHPEAADIIVFAEHHPDHDPYFLKVLTNRIYRKFKHKCFLYQDSDITIPLIQNISPSLEQSHYDSAFSQPFSYIIQLSPNPIIRQTLSNEKRFLFSFVGTSRTNPIRKKVFELTHPACYLLDTFDKNSWQLSEEEKLVYQENYARVSLESKFILCPRGIGPNSYRLYESMEMGVAPVIISDEWVPTIGPAWETFAIRIPESDIGRVVELLEAREPEALEMGRLARQAWEEWFAKDRQFHYLTEACAKLLATQSQLKPSFYIRQYKRFLEPFHTRNILRFCKKTAVRYFK